MIYILDASAVIAWLRNEPGADVVDKAIRDVNSQCIAHAANLCEVYYDAHRNAGEAHAEAVINGCVAGNAAEVYSLRSAYSFASRGPTREASIAPLQVTAFRARGHPVVREVVLPRAPLHPLLDLRPRRKRLQRKLVGQRLT